MIPSRCDANEKLRQLMVFRAVHPPGLFLMDYLGIGRPEQILESLEMPGSVAKSLRVPCRMYCRRAG